MKNTFVNIAIFISYNGGFLSLFCGINPACVVNSKYNEVWEGRLGAPNLFHRKVQVALN